MRNKLELLAVSLLISMSVATCGDAEVKNVSFKDDVQPILNDNCMHCHAGEKTQGNIHLDSYERLMESRYFNNPDPIAIAGKPEFSRLYIVVSSNNTGIRMPPESFGFDKLSESDIRLIKTWILEGAKDN